MPTNNRWDEIFREGGHVFHEPHEDMSAVAEACRCRSLTSILDLGCGNGRHLVYFSQLGFQVCGADYSESGLRLARQWLEDQRLPTRLLRQDMTQPFALADASFDAVISVQVIHHARLPVVCAIVAEIERVLKPGGLVFVSVAIPKERTSQWVEIEPNTWLPIDGKEQGLLHYFFTPAGLSEVFGNFEIARLYEDSTRHLCLQGYKKQQYI